LTAVKCYLMSLLLSNSAILIISKNDYKHQISVSFFYCLSKNFELSQMAHFNALKVLWTCKYFW